MSFRENNLEELCADAYGDIDIRDEVGSADVGDTVREVANGERKGGYTLDGKGNRAEQRFSIRHLGGEPISVVDLTPNTKKYDDAENYLIALVNEENPFATILSDAREVYLGSDLPGEYRGSKYTQKLLPKLRTAKMQAATNLDEMLQIAKNKSWIENKEAKHNENAKFGWYRYSTKFAVPALNEKKHHRPLQCL